MSQGSPSFEITLDGQPLSEAARRCLLNAELHESLDAIDMLSLELMVPEDPSEVLNLAKPGSTFRVRLGRGSSFRDVYGRIVEVSFSREPASPWKITYQGLDRLHELGKRRARKVRKGSDATVVKEIASECGLSPEVEDVSATGDYNLQLNEDYASFLLRVAKDNAYLVRVEEDSTLRFARRTTAYQSASVSLRWGENIERINLRASLAGVWTEVKVKGYDPVKGEWVSGSASASDLANFSSGQTAIDLAQDAYGDLVFEHDNARATTTSRANAVAAAMLQQMANSFVQGSIDCVGTPEACSGARLSIQDAGDPLSGDFVIGETVHRYSPDDGYRTTIHFFSDSLPAGGA